MVEHRRDIQVRLNDDKKPEGFVKAQPNAVHDRPYTDGTIIASETSLKRSQ